MRFEEGGEVSVKEGLALELGGIHDDVIREGLEEELAGCTVLVTD